jgi:hypothetical protein
MIYSTISIIHYSTMKLSYLFEEKLKAFTCMKIEKEIRCAFNMRRHAIQSEKYEAKFLILLQFLRRSIFEMPHLKVLGFKSFFAKVGAGNLKDK